MWTATKYGFFSTVRLIAEGQKTDKVMIRARQRGHLERLRERFKTRIGDVEILRQGMSDYLFRMIVPLETWASISAHLAAEIEYPNFKGEASRVFGHGDDYVKALPHVWSTFYDLQPNRSRVNDDESRGDRWRFPRDH